MRVTAHDLTLAGLAGGRMAIAGVWHVHVGDGECPVQLRVADPVVAPRTPTTVVRQHEVDARTLA